MAEDFEQLIGEKLVIGFPGTQVTPAVVEHFQRLHAGGVIFYRINFESPQQIRKAISDLEKALERRLLVCVDHEGGRVIMYRDGVTIFPDNLAVGQSGRVDLVRRMGEIAGEELRALGTDVNFSPVLDVLTQAYSPNIGIRSFGMDKDLVAKMGAAYIRALQSKGISATAKHFPGKGHAPLDAHLKLPTIQSSWEEMKNDHLPPFLSAIEAGVDVIMSSHPRYSLLDPDHIATFSRRIMTDFLRKELQFKGVLSSDDLEMGAIRDICSIREAGVRTVQAGHDLVLSCHDFSSQAFVFDGLVEAYRNKILPLSELEQSIQRIRTLKNKRFNRFEGTLGPHPDGKKLATLLAERGTRILQDKENLIPLNLATLPTHGVIFPQLSSFSEKIMIEQEFENETQLILNLVKPKNAPPQVKVYPMDPSPDMVQAIATFASEKPLNIFFCFDAHLYPAQAELLKAVQNTHRPIILVLLRDPYDASLANPQDAVITAYGFRLCQIKAVINRIYG